MRTEVKDDVNRDVQPEPAKKAWKKPMLDIFELRSAELGASTTPDGHTKHHSQ